MKTLLVQGDTPRRPALLELLEDRGHEVACREAAGPALASLEETAFDLVILDLALPGLDYPEFCRRLRAAPAGAWCVLVVLADDDRPRAIDEALRSGADDYIVAADDPELLGVDLAIAERRVEDHAARRRIMDALTESETRFRDLLQTAPDAIVRVDADGRIRLLNGQAERMFGYRADELIGQPVEVLVPEPYRAAHLSHRTRFFERPQTRPMGTGLNLSLCRKDASELPVDICLGHHRSGGQEYVIAAIRDVTERRRMEEELRLAKEAAEHAYERIHRDVQAAARLQRALLPANLPAAAGVRFAWDYRPCAGLGGDGLNVFWLDENHVGLYLLDVSGHGVAAALLSVTLARLLSPSLSQSTLLRVRRPDGDGYRIVPPAEVARQLNEWFLADQSGEQFFTLFYGILDLRARRLSFVSAGHPGLLHAPAGVAPGLLRVPGYPIGCMANPEYEERDLQLKPGDRLFVYSDGFTDALSPAGEPFGVPHLLRAIGSAARDSVDACVRRLARTVVSWAGGNPHDDLSVLALAVE